MRAQPGGLPDSLKVRLRKRGESTLLPSFLSSATRRMDLPSDEVGRPGLEKDCEWSWFGEF